MEGERYWFNLSWNNTQLSDFYYFKTLPKTENFQFVAGGGFFFFKLFLLLKIIFFIFINILDTGFYKTYQTELHLQAAKTNPSFAIIGGDVNIFSLFLYFYFLFFYFFIFLFFFVFFFIYFIIYFIIIQDCVRECNKTL